MEHTSFLRPEVTLLCQSSRSCFTEHITAPGNQWRPWQYISVCSLHSPHNKTKQAQSKSLEVAITLHNENGVMIENVLRAIRCYLSASCNSLYSSGKRDIDYADWHARAPVSFFCGRWNSSVLDDDWVIVSRDWKSGSVIGDSSHVSVTGSVWNDSMQDSAEVARRRRNDLSISMHHRSRMIGELVGWSTENMN